MDEPPSLLHRLLVPPPPLLLLLVSVSCPLAHGTVAIGGGVGAADWTGCALRRKRTIELMEGRDLEEEEKKNEQEAAVPDRGCKGSACSTSHTNSSNGSTLLGMTVDSVPSQNLALKLTAYRNRLTWPHLSFRISYKHRRWSHNHSSNPRGWPV